ncbi:glycosyltransferase involved in cell wall biosynthesis [Flavobacterium sp. 270]|uniref:glycosyltransferase family 2 protein n=1 Tax=Flavobacterium sp. 270 TaxID=2512114 RepID=UPI001065E00F|nr:glycosyltransferase [Flavobacterium sp. 270]TDW50212.1 glycosyltransferase involved in cell wall biosynthesis [Flavobacterium sp. 270]
MEEIKTQNQAVFFSIIVPVYNVEDYLEQCLDSIVSQSYTDFELLLINDGSTDSSLEICKKYQEKHQQIIIIDKENGGLSDARNAGLKAAKGDYIIFSDSDDYWVGSDVLLDLNNLIKDSNPDIVIHEESRFFSANDVNCKYNQQFLKAKKGSFKEEAVHLVYYDLYAAAAWDKVIRRAILTDNNLFFTLGRKSEDIEWTAKLMYYINTFSVYSKSFYHYRQARKGSITTSVNEKHVMDIYEMIKHGLQEEKTNSEKLNLAIENFWASNYIVILKEFYVLSSKMQNVIWNGLVSWKYLLQRDRNLKVDKVMNFYKYLNFKSLIFFLNGYRIKTTFSKRYRASK